MRATGEPPGPIGGQAPSGKDTVEMRMRVELLPPGMEHRQAADIRPEMLGVASNVLERLCHGRKSMPYSTRGWGRLRELRVCGSVNTTWT